MSRKAENILPPISKEKQLRRKYARPNNVVGRMKPVKVRKALRQWIREGNAEEEARTYEELEKYLP